MLCTDNLIIRLNLKSSFEWFRTKVSSMSQGDQRAADGTVSSDMWQRDKREYHTTWKISNYWSTRTLTEEGIR